MYPINTTNKRLFIRALFHTLRHYRQAIAAVALAFSAILPTQAKQVTPRQALDIARKYVSPNKTALKAHTRSGKQPNPAPYYVFNDAMGKGFVVVSGDDAMGEILAYGDKGALDTLNANPGVKFLLQAYRERFKHLQQFPEAPKPATRAMPERKVVAPLLTCEWDQVFPYNKNMGYPYTGCVATAVAQIMFYHKWPAQGRGENSYIVSSDNKEKHADFSKSHYDWANMKNKYNYYHPSNDVEKEAVAQLMSDVGIATGMQYTQTQSGAFNEQVGPAMQKHFDYTTAFVKRKDERLADFTDIIREELTNGFPVYLSGNPYGRGAGHAWVTDGINGEGLFHMNFGWGGQNDGYFSLSSLNLAQTGNEFGGRPMTFRYSLIAILIHPNKPNCRPIDTALLEDTPKLKFNIEGSLRLPEGSEKRFAVADMPAVEMCAFVNYGKAFKGDIGVGIFNMDGKLLTACPSDDYATGGFTQRIFSQYNNGMMGPDNSIVQAQKIKVDLSKLADGYYQLLPICAPMKADGKWGE